MDPSQNSLFRELESVHDSCLSQSQQEEEMQDLESQIVPQQSYVIQPYEALDISTHKVEGIGQPTGTYVDSSNISLSSESTEYPHNLDEMAFAIDIDSGPLQDMEISQEDFDVQSTQFVVFPSPNESGQQFAPPVPVHQQGPSNVQASVTYPNQPSSSNHVPVMNEQIQPTPLPSSTAGGSVLHSCKMPGDCEMKLHVNYMSSDNAIEKSISHGDGFLLFHEKTPSASLLPQNCQYVRFPALTKAEERSGSNAAKRENDYIPLTSKDKANIKHILDNMQGGLQVRCKDGCVYAKRWSKAKIFYHQCTTADGSKKELPRNKEVEIFNFYEYREKVLKQYDLYNRNVKSSPKDTNPVIYLTFAQKWVPGTVPLNKCLVWAKLTHSLAMAFWDGLLHPNENDNKGSLTNSYQDVLQFSAESTELNNLPPSTSRKS